MLYRFTDGERMTELPSGMLKGYEPQLGQIFDWDFETPPTGLQKGRYRVTTLEWRLGSFMTATMTVELVA